VSVAPYTTDRRLTRISASGQPKRAHVVFHAGGDEIGVVAHREVVAAAHGELVRGREQGRPPRLKSQRVVELAKDRQQRPVRQGSAQPGIELGVQLVRLAGIPEVAVPGAPGRAVDPGAEDREIRSAPMATDTETGCG
jgi:hypothetical protein